MISTEKHYQRNQGAFWAREILNAMEKAGEIFPGASEKLFEKLAVRDPREAVAKVAEAFASPEAGPPGTRQMRNDLWSKLGNDPNVDFEQSSEGIRGIGRRFLDPEYNAQNQAHPLRAAIRRFGLDSGDAEILFKSIVTETVAKDTPDHRFDAHMMTSVFDALTGEHEGFQPKHWPADILPPTQALVLRVLNDLSRDGQVGREVDIEALAKEWGGFDGGFGDKDLSGAARLAVERLMSDRSKWPMGGYHRPVLSYALEQAYANEDMALLPKPREATGEVDYQQLIERKNQRELEQRRAILKVAAQPREINSGF
jgi:hypothetical protein